MLYRMYISSWSCSLVKTAFCRRTEYNTSTQEMLMVSLMPKQWQRPWKRPRFSLGALGNHRREEVHACDHKQTPRCNSGLWVPWAPSSLPFPLCTFPSSVWTVEAEKLELQTFVAFEKGRCRTTGKSKVRIHDIKDIITLSWRSRAQDLRAWSCSRLNPGWLI